MKAKMYKIWLFALVGALALSLFGAAITYGRYGSNPSFSEDSLYGDIIDFIGAEKYIVRTPEELTAAIENGYSYIEIAEDAEQPFEVTTGVTDVEANLVIDINGNDVIRNSRNPLLNVQENVSVVIVFDSQSGTATAGSFYNPVGSSLQVAGGTLTIAAGTYDCGPREGERVALSGSNYITADGGKFAVTGATQEVTLHLRTGYEDGDYSSGNLRRTSYTTKTVTMPVITPTVTADGKVNGNMYFADGSLQGTTQGYNTYIKEDTFLLYGVSDVADPQPLCDAASCDFYYSYPIEYDSTSGTPTPTRYAVVYGYNDVMDGARDQIEATDGAGTTSQVVWPYAAIRMESGEAFARGGNYENHFGTANSYGIYAEGGNLVVSGSSAFTAVGDGVCIHCEESTTSGTAANLVVTGGTFASERGDTVQVEGGILYASGGTFTKSASAASGNSAIVRMTGGTFTGPASGFSHITMTAGSEDKPLNQVFGIYSVGGTVNLYRADITVYGTNASGVGATTSTEEGAVAPSIELYDSAVTISGSTSGQTDVYGVSAEGGSINLDDTEVSVSGTYSVGVFATASGGSASVSLSDSSVTLTNGISGNILTSTAVSAEGGNITLTGDNTITSNSLGITARSSGSVAGNITVDGSEGTETTVTTANGTGVYINGGSLAVNEGATLTVDATIPAAQSDSTSPRYTWPQQGNTATTRVDGIAIDGGSLTANGTLNVDFSGLENDDGYVGEYPWNRKQVPFDELTTTSYAVRVQGGAGSAKVTIASGYITAGGSLRVDEDGAPVYDQNGALVYDADGSGGGGVYVSDGTVNLGLNDGTPAGPTVTTQGNNLHTGYRQDLTDTEGSNWNYRVSQNGGPAIEVAGGSLYVNGGSYSSAQGDGILVRNGSATITAGEFSGKDNYNADGGGFVAGPGASYAFKVLGGTANVSGGRFASAGNGAFVMEGNATITAGIFTGAGASGFSVWRNATLVFGDEEKTEEQNNADLIVAAASTGIAVETNIPSGYNAADVTIHGGTFSGGTYSNTEQSVYITGDGGNRNGIWYGTSQAHVTVTGGYIYGEHNGFDYSAGAGATTVANVVQISGGTFEGEDRAGFLFQRNHWANNMFAVCISGGTFKGVPVAYGGHYYYGAIGTPNSAQGIYDGGQIKLCDIVKDGYNSTNIDVRYYSSKTNNTPDGTWQGTNGSSIRDNTAQYAKVEFFIP